MSPQDRRARNRLGAMMAARLAGAGLLALGIVLYSHAQAVLGTVALAAGIAATLVVPRALARRWRTPR